MSEAAEQITDLSIENEWDSLEDDAPTLEEVSDDNEEIESEEIEATDEDSEISAEEDSKEDVEVPAETESKSEEEDTGSTEEVKSLDINELDDDATVKVKVDGELQEISLKEFKNGISGSKAIAQKFTELDQAKKQYENELSSVNEYINSFAGKMKSGDAIGALEYLGSFAGMGSHQIRSKLIEGLLPEIQRLEGMSQPEIDLEYQRQETEYLKQRQELEQQQYQKEQSDLALQREITTAKQELGIEDAEWLEAIDYLDQSLPADQQITVDKVTEFVTVNRADIKAESTLAKVGENYVTDTHVDALRDIILQNPEFTDEDLVEIVNSAFADAQNQAVEEQIQEQTVKTEKVKATPKQEVNNNQFEEIDFDDWDDIL